MYCFLRNKIHVIDYVINKVQTDPGLEFEIQPASLTVNINLTYVLTIYTNNDDGYQIINN